MAKAKTELVTHWDHFSPTNLGLKVLGEPTYDQWAKCGEFFHLAEIAAQWWIGDWLNYGEKKYGETFAQAIEVTGLRKQTLMNLKWVASKFEISRRRENLTFRHHSEVASLSEKEADKWLNRAEKETLSASDIRRMIQGEKGIITPAIESPKPLEESDEIHPTPDDLVEIDGDPSKCLEAVAGMAKALKKWKALFSSLMATPFVEQVEATAGGYTNCEPQRTGERVELGQMGPIKFGPLEYTCDALDELAKFCGGLKAAFTRLGRAEVPGEGVGGWERGD